MGARRRAPELADGIPYVPPEYRRNFPPGYGPMRVDIRVMQAWRRERGAWLAQHGLGGSQVTREEMDRRRIAFERSEEIDGGRR